MTEAPYQNTAHIATIIASVVATLTLGFGYFQFRATQRATQETLRLQRDTFTTDREIRAVDLFIRFNEIQEKGASWRNSGVAKLDPWRANILVTITESVFRLTKGDAGWKATVRFMLKSQSDLMSHPDLDCTTFDRDFVDLVRKVTEKRVCS